MPKRKPLVKKSKFAILPFLGIAAIVAVLLGTGGMVFASSQEDHDSFCASCHTQPESTFFERSTASTPVDLASAHTPKEVRCIDCHSGSGVTGRIQAEMMGARNALMWYTGTAIQPAKVTFPIQDSNCLKCHSDVTLARTQNNHFHYFLARWQAADAQAAHCVSCHGGHSTDGSADTAFLTDANVQPVCQACHNVLKESE